MSEKSKNKEQAITITPSLAISFSIDDYATDYTGERDESSSKKEFKKLIEPLAELQEVMHATGSHGLLVVLQGMDCSGKTSTTDKVFSEVSHAGLRMANFKKPTPEEMARDFLWRVHQQIPRRGEIVVFDRSHYEDVLIQRVHEWVSPTVIKQRYEQIRNFELLLTQTGITVLKFFLHISYEYQTSRLQRRLRNLTKHWKFSANDLEERKYWDQYMEAYELAIRNTSSDYAPWHVIPADNRWMRDEIVARVVVEALKKMDLEWPSLPEELRDIKIK
ncbi:MAG: PPK2 family polyphosphate kinase [Verrucomicrobiales bacterium]